MALDLQAIRHQLQQQENAMSTTDYSIPFSYLQKYLECSIDNTKELLNPVIRGECTKGVLSTLCEPDDINAYLDEPYPFNYTAAEFAAKYPHIACNSMFDMALLEGDMGEYWCVDKETNTQYPSVVVVCDSAYIECIEACARTTCQFADMNCDIIIFYRRETEENTGVPVAYSVYKNSNGHSEALASAEPYSPEWQLAYIMQHHNE